MNLTVYKYDKINKKSRKETTPLKDFNQSTNRKQQSKVFINVMNRAYLKTTWQSWSKDNPNSMTFYKDTLYYLETEIASKHGCSMSWMPTNNPLKPNS